MSPSFDLTAHPEFAEIWEQAKPYTMTSPERGFALYKAVHAVLDNGIEGRFVECGVWRGGSAMIMALTLMQRGVHRELVLFDTYEGMTEPGEADRDINDKSAADLMAGSDGESIAELVVASAGLEGVREAITSTGYNMGMVRFIKGDVRTSLPETSTQQIALLRLGGTFGEEVEVLSGLAGGEVIVHG